MRRMTQILMVLAVVAMTAAPAFAQRGRGHGPSQGPGYGSGHRPGHGPAYRPPARSYSRYGHGHGRYVPGYKQLWWNTAPSYYHAPHTRYYRPGCYTPYYGGSVGYYGGNFGFQIRF